ncbi:tyrosine-type recombinase/integrase [Aeromonas allosaccharophila]
MYLKTASKLNSELKEMKIERPKTPRKLPNVLSKEEIIKIVSVLKNLKHRTVISLIYSAGLRISEAVKMEIRDIDFPDYP